jgi:type VI secretion system protein ImpH
VWDVQSRFRIRIGPVAWPEFEKLLPGTAQQRCLVDMIRLYVGIQMDFDIQLLLRRPDVPRCRLAADAAYEPRLGWTTWIGADESAREPAAEAVFRFQG